ncbi:MAG: universal stress protein [Ferruginibacter sp.]
MKKIIIALDYNPSAEKVAEKGYEIAKAMQAEITLVHVITEPAFYAMQYSPIMGYTGSYTEGTVEVVDDINNKGKDFLIASVKHLGDDSIKTKLLSGDDVDESVLKYCEKQQADVLIIGSHSHKGLAGIFDTDVSSDLIKHTKIPLLIIPTGE